VEPDDKVFKTLVDDMAYGVCLVGTDGRVTYWNRAAEQITGFSKDEVIGEQSCDDILKPVDKEGNSLHDHGSPLGASLEDGQAHETTLFLHHKDGHRFPVSASVAPILDGNGKIIAAAEVFRENSIVVAAQERIEELETLSLIDPLTKLGNRLYIEMNLLAKLHELRRYGWPFGVLFMDVDDFKDINDAEGHDTGDKMLVIASKALRGQSRPFDVVGRWGGDEFFAIVVHVSAEQLLSIAERYRCVITDARLHEGSEIIQTTVSVGATLGRPDDSVDSLYRRVDQLMYESKAAGKNRVTLDVGA